MRLISIALLSLPMLAQMVPPGGPPTLKDVLALTSDQAQKIATLFSDYDSYRRTANTRMQELNSDLRFQFSQPAPDPAQVGADYAEAETIRRGLAAQQTAYRAQVLAILNPAQRTQYQTLLNSVVLQPLLSEASCAFLENSFESSFASFLLGGAPVPTIAFRSGDFVSLTGFLSVALPYVPPAPAPTFCGSSVFPLALREYLNATDAEIAAIAQSSMDYNDLYQRRQNRIGDVQVEIRDETAKDRPDPVELGVRYVELQMISKDLQQQSADFRQRARGALTGDRAAKLKLLDDLVAAQPALSVLQSCDLLVPPPASQSQEGFLGLAPITGNPIGISFASGRVV
ncbi:MAG: periplasmic heavy metal sensor [Acidobacteriota bacterium]|nr:periplasmic heavy metal sensor [Acidobacteriota bacterium]